MTREQWQAERAHGLSGCRGIVIGLALAGVAWVAIIGTAAWLVLR